MRSLRILGTRGVPATHGGFETFAERLALYLVDKGWHVTVYCQEDGAGPIVEDEWRGVRRVRISVADSGPFSTVKFDWIATGHAARTPGLCLTLGYNTAAFCARLNLARRPNLINMDGIEWRRAKWGLVPKIWFWLNEHAGSRLATHLVADHPEIARHLERSVPATKITTIAYGADQILAAPDEPVRALKLVPGQYLILIARPEPENSVLEMVKAFSSQRRAHTLAVLGAYLQDSAYHREVRAAASDQVLFLGAIYDRTVVQALRFHSALHLHGHKVGGTNPSLVEALGAGNAVIAHDNRFNRWVLGDAGRYFDNETSLDMLLTTLLDAPHTMQAMRQAAVARFKGHFTWPAVLDDYEQLLCRFDR